MFTEAISANCLPISYWNEEVNYLYEVERRDVWSNLAVTVETLDDLGQLAYELIAIQNG